ncbi:MAG: hypothetical protein P8J20_04350 [Novosphingobium sp.]|nr:hypothetical protein [Novosphingobium sp.]
MITTAQQGKNLTVRERIDYPDLGSVTEAGLGEEMLRQGTFTEVEGIELPQLNRIDRYTLSAGFYPQIAEDKDYTYHAFRMNRSRTGYGHIGPARTTFLSEILPAPSAIRAAKSRQQTCVIVRDFLSSACDTEKPYKQVTRTQLTQSDLQQKLIYEGRDGNRIRIRYSETSGHYARPEFSREEEYDLGQSDEIAYKGARIKVLQADGTVIRYQVLSKLTGW